MRNKLLVYILTCSFLFQSVILIPNTSAVEIPEPYIYTYAPSNSFGATSFKEVNWSYFKQLFNAHTSWLLEYKRYSTSSWTNGNQYLSINKTWMDDGYWKFGLYLNVPIDVYAARFTFACDLQLLNYVDKGENQIYLNYPISNTDEYYNCTFDYSDLINIPDIIFMKGKTDNKFWFRFQKDNIKAGNYYFDPTFGFTGDTANVDIVTVANVEYLYAGASLPANGGTAYNITIKTGTVLAAACSLHCALYYYPNGSLLAQTETKSVSATSTVYTFNFVTPIVMTYNNYYIAVAPAVDYSDSKQRTIRRGGSGNQYYKSGVNGANFPDPISGLSTTASAAPYIYCSYIANSQQTGSFNIATASINLDNSTNQDIHFSASDVEGNNFTITETLKYYPSSVQIYTSKTNGYNRTLQINHSQLNRNTFYQWTVLLSDQYYKAGYAYTVVFATISNNTLYENIVDATGTHETAYVNNLTGWKTWANYTGSGGVSSLTLYENIVNATGTHEYSNMSNHYYVWANYTGNTTALHHFEDIVNAVGTHNHSLQTDGWYIWANYTGNATGNITISSRDRFVLGITIGSFSFIIMGYVLYRRKRKS